MWAGHPVHNSSFFYSFSYTHGVPYTLVLTHLMYSCIAVHKFVRVGLCTYFRTFIGYLWEYPYTNLFTTNYKSRAHFQYLHNFAFLFELLKILQMFTHVFNAIRMQYASLHVYVTFLNIYTFWSRFDGDEAAPDSFSERSGTKLRVNVQTHVWTTHTLGNA